MQRLVELLARAMAILGGLILTALVVLTCVSVLGRGLNTLGHSGFLEGLAPGLAAALLGTGVGPVTGDFELVETGVAFAIFSFLPACQYYGAHATVDVFTSFLSPRANRVIIAFWEVVLAAVIVLITWRLFEGMQDKMRYGETSFLLQYPVWWGYAASLFAAVIASLVAIYCAAARWIEIVTGKRLMPAGEGAVH
ncbi:TRAP transporter small permease [Litorisediminicola beolgyonensis]|uniref:TRAP transporter small permease protein n=1 Tax=Litorisediminicola beolgyonensis TaxID=1173614 RepID=A0ABW3ZL51_9RHOB